MRSPAKSFQDLIVWQKAHAFVLQVYAASRGFPKEELYELTSQLRRQPSQCPRISPKDFESNQSRTRPGS